MRNIFTLKPGPLFIGFAAGFVYSILLIIFLVASEINQEYFQNRYSLIYNRMPAIRYTGYVLLIVTMLMVGVFNGGQFIYFQF